jgi:lipopolysaccharide transport system ATP-binding protein
MTNTAITVENLYKEYKLGVISHGTLYRDMQSWWARLRGKEDPNSLISEHHGEDAEKDSFLALNDISFEVKEGERLGIIGKNGAGKSTLLKILSQITSPSRGQITIHGKIGSLLEVGTGFHPELTGRDNIYLNGSILGMTKREITAKLDEIVDFAGIEKHLDTPVKRYSSGMMVRLGFAVAAHLDTDILIADEVLAVGDAEFQDKALGKMKDLSTGQGRTVLFVSHNMGAMKKLCEQGIVLEKGKIKYYGGMDDCITDYLYSSRSNLNNKPELLIEPDEAIAFFVNKIEILDYEDQQKDTYESQEENKIRIHCVSKKPVSGLYGYIAIRYGGGEYIISCNSNETEDNVFSNLPKGNYCIDVIIPKSLLVPGDYFLYFQFTDLKSLFIPNPDEYIEGLSLKIVDTKSDYGNNRGALTAIILDWKITNIN